jgi:hypothetical protein
LQTLKAFEIATGYTTAVEGVAENNTAGIVNKENITLLRWEIDCQ